MDKMTILEDISRNDSILSLPQALNELLKEIEKSNYSTESLARIIMKDPALTSRILKLANSSFYQRFTRTTTVHQAVQVLGISTVKCMALSSSILNSVKFERAAHINPKHFFADILSVAVAAEKIAKVTGFKATDEAFIAGLLHDVGLLYLINHYPEQHSKLSGKAHRPSGRLAVEQETYGVDHCEVGYHLAIRWRLPVQICESIRDHHNFTLVAPGITLPNIIRLASLLGHGSSDDSGLDPIERMSRVNQLGQALKLTREQLEEATTTLLADALAAASFLDTDIGSPEELLTRANREIWRTYLVVHNLFQERQELSQKLLKEERAKGAMESKNIAIATLSHYVNNAAMAMYGRIQLLRHRLKQGQPERAIDMLPSSLDVIENGLKKTVAVIAEIKDISPIEDVEFYNLSQAMKLDDRIDRRMKMLDNDSGMVIPEDDVFEPSKL